MAILSHLFSRIKARVFSSFAANEPAGPDKQAAGIERLHETNGLARVFSAAWFPVFLFIIYFSIPFVVHFTHLLAGETLVFKDGVGGIFSFQYLSNSIKNMDIPLWTPYLAGGMPYAEISSGMLYPVRWLCSLLPDIIQLYAYFGVHYAIGGVAMFSFLKRIRCTPYVSAAISTVYLFTVHMGGERKEHIGLIVAALYLPVIFYFLERYLQEKRLKWLLCASAAMALQFLGGFLQYVVYSDIFVFFYLLCSGIHGKFRLKQMLKHGVSWFLAYFGMIFANILPMLQFMRFLSGEGGSGTSYEYFTTLSLHPAKLLMSIFPYLFGADVLTGLIAYNYTSGVDAELVIGAAAVAAIIAGFMLFRKNFHVRFMSIAAIVTLAYACLGQFPLLAEIVYQIPVLNVFRVPSRTLFLMTFSCVVIMAVSVNAFCVSENYASKFHAANLFVAGITAAVIAIYPIFDLLGLSSGLSAWRVLGGPVILFCIYLSVFYIGKYIMNHGLVGRTVYDGAVIFTIACLTIIQMFPFYAHTNYLELDQSITFPSQVSESAGTDKVWSSGLSAGQLVHNESIAMQLPALNAYTNFNLPNLYKYINHTNRAPVNASGMYINFSNVPRTMNEDNALLSMFGVKYVMVPAGTSLEAGMPAESYIAADTLIETNSISMNAADGIRYAEWNAGVEPDSLYRISATVEALQGGGQFYVDLYSLNYDNTEQEAWFEIQQGRNTYEAVLPSQNCPTDRDVFARIVFLTDSEVEILDFKVEKVVPPLAPPYSLFLTGDKYDVYENLNVRPLIYAPDRVESVTEESKDELYLNTSDYDILNVSYITGGEGSYDFSDANVKVSDIVLTNNRAAANVHADKDAFVNMSQTFYPGWNAYVDGKKTEVYEVNGLIQGAFFPAGDHLVEFKYQPAVYFTGLCISAGTIAVCIIASVFSEKKLREKKDLL